MANDNQYDHSLSLDEIVFENRNKEYGAYDLRFNYSKILTKAFVIGTLLFVVFALSPLIYATIERLTAPPKTEIDAKMIDILEEEEIIEEIKEEEKDEPAPPPPAKEEPVQQEVIQNVVPEPVKAPPVETPPPPITKQLETTTGAVAQEGVKTTTFTPPPPPPSTPGKGTAVEAKPAVSEKEIYEKVEQEVQFPGGINAFRSKVADNFDTSALEGEGTMKTEVTFVVEIDGTISQVKATGSNSDFNREAERTIKGIKTKWKPAKINNLPVRSRFRLPLTMNFE